MDLANFSNTRTIVEVQIENFLFTINQKIITAMVNIFTIWRLNMPCSSNKHLKITAVAPDLIDDISIVTITAWLSMLSYKESPTIYLYNETSFGMIMQL